MTAAGYRVITYDRRGFGRSGTPATGYTYDTLAEDLHTLLAEFDLNDVTLVGFSMGGGEVARYFANYGSERLHSAVFASAVPPALMQTTDNPAGPLTLTQATAMSAGLSKNQDEFYDQFVTDFFTAGGVLKVSQQQREAALELTKQANTEAALACMSAFANTDFRHDLTKVDVPTLVLHGDSDMIVPYEGSGQRTHEAIKQSEVHVIVDGPHGCNVSHAEEWNRTLTEFLAR